MLISRLYAMVVSDVCHARLVEQAADVMTGVTVVSSRCRHHLIMTQSRGQRHVSRIVSLMCPYVIY